MTVSNKMERIMRQDSNLSPYDGFRIGGIGKVLNQIGLNQRKHHIIYKVSSGEFAIPMEFTGNVMEMQLIPKEEILEELRKLMFDIHPRIAYNLADQDFSRVLTLHQDFKRKDLMKEGNRPYSITYRIAYALSNTHHSDLFLRKEYIEIPRIFKEFAKQPVVGRYEGMLEIAGHEFLVAGRENGCMTLGLSFLEDHKPWGRKGRDFSQKILILNTGIREAKIMIGGALERPGLGKRGDFDAKLTNPKMQDKRKFGKVSCLSGNRDSSIAIVSTRNLRKKSRTSGKPGRTKDNGHKRRKHSFSRKCQATHPEKFQ
ncbi:movement protein [Sesamum angolense]|uniref:Movement protein n=1 Tax=Sesamum angolense TaxID=2727404 RepID=A0AAE2BTX2_9LAMI|nr:movement protein [Sesamum angolense]